MAVHVSTQVHSEYSGFSAIWQKCRDAREGEDAVKARGVTYLPKLGLQSDDQYAAYNMRGRFFNAFAKTIDGHIGLATRKPAILDVPPAADDVLANVDRKGSTFADFMKSALRETLEVNRSGTLVEYPVVAEGATRADVKGLQPYLILYKAEDIRDWEYDENNKLSYVLLRERIPYRGNRVVAGKEFRYRECELVDGIYTQTVWIEGELESEDPIQPKKDNAPLTEIPFKIHQSETSQHVEQPVLIDLVNLVYSHYRLKADHAHALHYAALPTPWVTGVDSDSKGAPKSIGPEQIWLIGAVDAKVGMLEFTGAGVEAIANELKTMEDQMAILGSRVLLPELSEHTATASKLRSISETSDLASVVMTLEKQFDDILNFLLQWSGISTPATVDMSTEFMPTEMDAQLITAMVAAWQAGAISHDILLHNLQKAEIVPGDENLDELKDAIAEEDDERMEKAAVAIAASVNANPAPAKKGDTE